LWIALYKIIQHICTQSENSCCSSSQLDQKYEGGNFSSLDSLSEINLLPIELLINVCAECVAVIGGITSWVHARPRQIIVVVSAWCFARSHVSTHLTSGYGSEQCLLLILNCQCVYLYCSVFVMCRCSGISWMLVLQLEPDSDAARQIESSGHLVLFEVRESSCAVCSLKLIVSVSCTKFLSQFLYIDCQMIWLLNASYLVGFLPTLCTVWIYLLSLFTYLPFKYLDFSVIFCPKNWKKDLSKWDYRVVGNFGKWLDLLTL